MFEVRQNEIALRKLSGGTAQWRTLEGTLPVAMLQSSGIVVFAHIKLVKKM